MAKPRIFVSSTYYDLKHIRSSLDLFVESLGFESILSEKGDIAYSPDAPLDESCYREASTADIFVLLIGGRYGSEASSGASKRPSGAFYERYESITKKEYEEAVNKDIPIYILVEAPVYAEYQTFLRNKDNEKTRYAHADSANIFRLIEEILARPRNNPVQTFDRFADIESWLRDQWAGLFRDLLHRRAEQKQFSALSTQIESLGAINNTLKRYLEAMMSGVSREDSSKLIETEEKRLEERARREELNGSAWYRHVNMSFAVGLDDFIQAVTKANSFDDFAERIGKCTKSQTAEREIKKTLLDFKEARADFNKIRKTLDLPIFRKSPSDLSHDDEDE